jgi:hypothetical protein
VFKTALIDSDLTKLIEISERMNASIFNKLQARQFGPAAQCLVDLKRLEVIAHSAVERLIAQSTYQIGNYFHQIGGAFNTECNLERFDNATELLSQLEQGLQCFGEDLDDVIKLESKLLFLKEMKARFQNRKDKEVEEAEKLKNAQNQIKTLIQLLDEQKKEQKQEMAKRLKEQEEQHEKLRKDMEMKVEETMKSFKAIKEKLESEMSERIEQKVKEVSENNSNASQEKINRELEVARSRLEAEYQVRIHQADKEKKDILRQQEEEKRKIELEMERTKEEATRKLKKIELLLAEKLKEQQAAEKPEVTDPTEAPAANSIAVTPAPPFLSDKEKEVKHLADTKTIDTVFIDMFGVCRTGLGHASYDGDVEKVALLLKYGANINLKDKSRGYTAVIWAALKGKIECLKLLIDAKADLNLQDTNGLTAVMRAALNGEIKCLKLLIDAKADLNLQDTDGDTAVMWAARRGYIECLKLLIDAKADLNLQNKNGKTALKIARDKGGILGSFALIKGTGTECVSLLEQAGAKE